MRFRKTRETNSYHPTFILKRGGNECVLTKISHNFHCHFNAPTLCGGLQSHRWRQRVGRGRGKGRLVERERLSGAWIVCQSPSIPLTMQPHKQTLADTITRHTNAHTHICACHPDPLSTHFETLKMRLSKGVRAWQHFLSPLGGYRGQARLSWKE